MTKKKILIVGAYGVGNLGDEAILAGILNVLRADIDLDRNKVIVFSRNPGETTRFHGVDARRRNPFDLLTANEVIIGGGELFQDLGNMAIKYSLLGLITKIIRKRVMFYAIGVSSNRSRLGKFLMRLGLNVADNISVRDRASKKHLLDIGVNKTISIVNDPSHHAESISREAASCLFAREGVLLDERKIRIGITSQRFRNKELNERMHKFLSSFLRDILAKYPNVYVVFAPFNSHMDDPLDRDIIYGKRLEKCLETDRFKVLRNKYTPQEMMGAFGLLDIVISTLLHPLIFAFKMDVSAIGIGVFEKVFSYCQHHNINVVKIDELKKLYNLTDNLINQKLRKDEECKHLTPT